MTSRLKHALLATVLSASLLGARAPASAAGTLLIAREADSTTFDPIATQQNPDCWIYPNIFAGLVKASVDGTKIEPNLAESWTNSADGLTYTFKLRPNLKFSDGSPIKASDVRFSILRARDTKESAWTSLYSGIADVVPTDDQTIVFTLKAPSAVFLANIAMFAAVVLPEAAMTTMGEEAFAQKPVVSGAFAVDAWKHGDRVILTKNPNYWNASHVSLDRVEWIIVANDNTRILKLQAKEVDAAILIPFNRVAELQKTAGLTVHLDASTREDFLVMNETRKPFDNVDVRKAINMALDRKAIVETVTFGIGQVANSYIPKGALYYNAANKDYAYDLEGAKALMKKAGITSLKAGLLVTAGDSSNEQMAVLMKDQLAKIGIDLTVTKKEQGQAFDTLTQGDYDLSIQYWTNDIIDPDEKTAFSMYGDDTNKSFYTGYKNAEVTKLIDQSRVELDTVKRAEIYNKIQQIVRDDAQWADLFYSPYRNATATSVKNFTQNPLGGFTLEDTTVDR